MPEAPIQDRKTGLDYPVSIFYMYVTPDEAFEVYAVSIEDAYEQKPELVVISSPTANHAKDIIQATDNGADVFVEKPGAANLPEAKSVANDPAPTNQPIILGAFSFGSHCNCND